MDWGWADMQRQEDGAIAPSLSFTPGVDFDPTDPDEVEIVGLAMEHSAHERMRHLERENATLRGVIEDLQEGTTA